MSESNTLTIIVVLIILGTLLSASVTAASPTIKRPYELYIATLEGGSPSTVDPAWCYDTASCELIFNVYETLVFFDGERADTYIPQLATEWIIRNITGETSPEALAWHFRYIFEIRTNVTFHNNLVLTPQDVEYSFERAMVQETADGPTWMFYEPLLNTWGAEGLGNLSDPIDIINVGKMIDHAVESNETHVWFNLVFPGPYAPFMQILSQPWSSILCKAWVNDYVIDTLGRSDWNGDWNDYSTWINYHDPYTSPLDYSSPLMCGTGPYQLATFDYNSEYWKIQKYDEYWRGWPPSSPAPQYPSDPEKNIKPSGFVTTVKVTWGYDWSTRKSFFLNGDVDFCAVPRQNISEVVGQPGVRCIYPLRQTSVTSMLFTFNISLTTPYGTIFDDGEFHEEGVPRDFFGNIKWGKHVRLAFAYCFDYQTYLEKTFSGEAFAPATVILPGVPYYDPSVPTYTYDLTAAEEEFKQVPRLWNTGFTITITYNQGNTYRQNAAENLRDGINLLNNTKFHVQVVSLWNWPPWPTEPGDLSVYFGGWLADYLDPHSFVYPFYYSQGSLASFQLYENPIMDSLIEAGIQESDPIIRNQIYHDIQELAREETPSIPIYCLLGRHFERDWCVGWYYNPLFTGVYAYGIWKWYYVPHSMYDDYQSYETRNLLSFDLNYDGKVDMKDVGYACKAFGSYDGPPMHPRWNFRCDASNDRKIDMKDIGRIAKYFGKTSTTWSAPL